MIGIGDIFCSCENMWELEKARGEQVRAGIKLCIDRKHRAKVQCVIEEFSSAQQLLSAIG